MTSTITSTTDFAMAPSIKTATANARLLSIYGAGGTGSNQPAFALPIGNGVNAGHSEYDIHLHATVPAGGSVTFSLSAVIATNPLMLGNEIKYAGLTITAAVPGSESTWPLSGILLMLGMTLLALADRTRRRALILAVLALGLAAGCGGSNNSPRFETSAQEVTAVTVTAGGVPETVAGVPASLGTVSD